MRGFVLSMDAMFAAMTALAMAAVLSSLLSASSVTAFNEQQVSSTGNDLIATLQSSNTLNGYIGQSNLSVNTSLQKKLNMLPPNYCGNISVKVFRADNFLLVDQYGAVRNCTTGASVVVIKRVFADYNKERFGLVELKLGFRA